MQRVTRALSSLPCQLAPTQASGPKPLFCTWLSPPRHCGDNVAKAESDDVSAAGVVAAAAAAFPSSVPAPAAPAAPAASPVPAPAAGALEREVRYTAIGSMSA